MGSAAKPTLSWRLLTSNLFGILLIVSVVVKQASALPVSADGTVQQADESEKIEDTGSAGQSEDEVPYVAVNPIKRSTNDSPGWTLPPQAPFFPGSPVSPGPAGDQLEARLTTPDRAHGTSGKAWYSNPFGYSPEARLPSTVTGIPLATSNLTPHSSGAHQQHQPLGSSAFKTANDVNIAQHAAMPSYSIPGSNAADRAQAVFKVAYPELLGSSMARGDEPAFVPSTKGGAEPAGPTYALPEQQRNPGADSPPIPLHFPHDGSSNSDASAGVVKKDVNCAPGQPCDRSELMPVMTSYEAAPVDQQQPYYQSGPGMDKAIEYSNGIRCYVCGDVDSQGNVVIGCPPKTGSVKDWVYSNKIRTWVCPSGCLTVKDDKTQTYAMMCHHTGESKLGYRLANPEKNNSRISRCYYGGCNGDNLDTFLGRAADSGSAKTSQNVLAVVVVTSVAAALL